MIDTPGTWLSLGLPLPHVSLPLPLAVLAVLVAAPFFRILASYNWWSCSGHFAVFALPLSIQMLSGRCEILHVESEERGIGDGAFDFTRGLCY